MYKRQGCGNVLPGELVRVFVTFNGIFSEFLGFIIPLIILGLVTPAIGDIGKEAGKMLVITTSVSYTHLDVYKRQAMGYTGYVACRSSHLQIADRFRTCLLYTSKH